MSQQQQQPFFPTPLEQASAQLEFVELSEGQRWQIDPFDLLCKRLNHPSYTGGFRLECGGKTFAYISDTDLYGPKLHGEGMDQLSTSEQKAAHLALQKSAGDLAHRADLMVCDTFFLPEEYQDDWGHGCPDDALRLSKEAEVRKIAFFHHEPHRSDAAIDEIVERYRGQGVGAFEILAAAEGLELLL